MATAPEAWDHSPFACSNCGGQVGLPGAGAELRLGQVHPQASSDGVEQPSGSGRTGLLYGLSGPVAVAALIFWVGPGWFLVLLFLLLVLSPVGFLLALFGAILLSGRVRVRAMKENSGQQIDCSIRAQLTGKRILCCWAAVYGVLLVLILSASYVVGWRAARDVRASASAATKLVVRVVDMPREYDSQEKILHQTSDLTDIQDFARQIRFTPMPFNLTHGCWGDLAFEFYNGNKLLSRHVLAHDDIFSDLTLSGSSQEALQAWLHKRGVTNESIQKARRN
jgi:hypothetical protein